MIVVAALAAQAAEEAHGAEASGVMSDPGLYVLAAFLIVLAIFWRAGAFKALTRALDGRGRKIADELNEARQLRDEAQALLAQFQRRQREAESEAKGIIEQARRDAQVLAAETRDRIDEQIERRARAAEEKIARAEAQAIAEVRDEAAEMAVEIARKIIRDRMDQGAQAALVDRAISDIRAKAN